MFDPDTDEELAEIPRPAWLGTPKRRRAVAAVAVAVLAILVGARLATSHPSTRHRAVPYPSPFHQFHQSRPATVGVSPVDVTPGRPNFRKDDPSHCPDTIKCTGTLSVPPGVLAAIRTYLPDAAVSDTHDSVVQVDPPRLYFRQVHAIGNGVTVVIRVARSSPSEADPTEETDDTGVESIGYVRAAVPGGYEVQVQFTGLPGWKPPMAAIRALARDPRLIALD